MTDQAILDFWRVAERSDPRPTNPILSKKKQTADEMAFKYGYPMVVVDLGNEAYEIYPKSVAVKWDRKWVYGTKDGTEVQ